MHDALFGSRSLVELVGLSVAVLACGSDSSNTTSAGDVGTE